MIVSFFGHASFVANEKHTPEMLNLLECIVGHRQVDFYLGGYGGFDRFAENCCIQYRFNHPIAKLIFVTPYPIFKE